MAVMTWMKFLATDELTLGLLKWAGVLFAIAGFARGLWQLRKIRKASDAAAEATVDIKNFIRSRSVLADLVGAATLIDVIKAHVGGHNFEASLIFIDQLRSRVVGVKRLIVSDDKEAASFDEMLMTIREISANMNDMSGRPKKETDTVPVLVALDAVSDGLHAYIAPLRIEGENQGEKE
jgi:hypothetical protein